MSSDIEFQQRVIYAGLSRMSTDRNFVKSAYQHWQRSHVKGEFDIFEVVSDLVSFLGLEVQEKKALMIGMHAASNKLLDELEAVPPYMGVDKESVVEEVEQNNNTIAPLKPDHIQVTERFMQLCSQHTKRLNNEGFRELVQVLNEEGVGGGKGSRLTQHIQNWARAGLDLLALPKEMTESECRDLAHDYYIILSEVVGPVDADTVVNKAISETMTMDSAIRFSPQKLL